SSRRRHTISKRDWSSDVCSSDLDPSGMKTTAKRDGSDWILNGAKMWITNSPVSDVMVVWAKTEELDDKGRPVVRGFVVPSDTEEIGRASCRGSAGAGAASWCLVA